MKRILINATHNEEIRVALCKDNHLYDFDLENRTREQKKANIYKGHVTRVEPSLEAVFVEYGSQRQGFLPIREIANEYLKGNPREDNIRKLIKEGDELIIQIEKEERGNKGAALSTFVSLAGRYLVLMPNNPRGGGISRQITGKLREDMKRMLANMDLPKGMSVIVRTAGIGKTQEDLQHDLNHLLNIWDAIQTQNKKFPSPRLVHQEAGVVTRAVRDYLRDDISEIWIDSENAFNEAENFVKAVMPKQLSKLRKYTDFEPMFASFNIEKQIETAYQREVRLPSGGSIVIDQTEALVSIDINSAKSTKGSDVSETAYHTNLEAAEEIARQLRLRDMGGLIVIDFIDMQDSKHQKEVEKRLLDSTKYDRARVQFGTISKFGLMEMSRQRLRPSLEESTGYICPRCHGNGMIRDLRSLSLSIMRQIEEIALKQRHGEVQAEVPTDIAAFLLNEKRESIVYLEQDSGTRITILPHSHLESPNFNLHFNHDGFVPASYERISDTQEQETSERGYEVNWQTKDVGRPEQQPIRQPKNSNSGSHFSSSHSTSGSLTNSFAQSQSTSAQQSPVSAAANSAPACQAKPETIAWLSNLFAPTPAAYTSDAISSQQAASAIEAIVNTGAQSLGAFGTLAAMDSKTSTASTESQNPDFDNVTTDAKTQSKESNNKDNKSKRRSTSEDKEDKDKRKSRSQKPSNRGRGRDKAKYQNQSNVQEHTSFDDANKAAEQANQKSSDNLPKRRLHSKRDSRGRVERSETLIKAETATAKQASNNDLQQVVIHVNDQLTKIEDPDVIHISLDNNSVNSKKVAASESKTSSPEEAINSKDNQHGQDDKEDKDDKDGNSRYKEPVAHANVLDNPNNGIDDNDSLTGLSQTVDSLTTKVNATSNGDSNTPISNTSYSVDTLFAGRYVTAHKYGKAKNDPRVVRSTLANSGSIAPQKVLVNDTTTTQTQRQVKGTVGQFIKNTLENGEALLQQGHVITGFLSALAHLQAQSPNQSTIDASKALPITQSTQSGEHSQDFNFSNYGYESLPKAYLENFHNNTSAVASTSVAQGKVDWQPATIGKRASNDPRGQHVDYVAKDDSPLENSQVADSSILKPENAATPMTASTSQSQLQFHSDTDGHDESIQPSTTNQAAFTKLMSSSVGHFIEQILGENGRQMLDQGKTESAFLQALKQPMSDILQHLQAANSDVHALKQETAHALAHPKEVGVHEDSSDVKSDNVKSGNVKSGNVQSDTQSFAKESSIIETVTETLSNIVEETVMNIAHDTVVAEDTVEDTVVDAVDNATNHESAEADITSDTASNNTTIASYKSMIETISEQLSPQTGLFNFTPSKAPKSRSRKQKSSKTDSDHSNNDASKD